MKDQYINPVGNKKKWYQNPLYIGLIAIILGLGGYFGWPYLPSVSPRFTEYKPLPVDSILNPIGIVMSDSLNRDTTSLNEKSDSNKLGVDTMKMVSGKIEKDSSSNIDFLKVNKSFKKEDNSPAKKNEVSQLGTNEDLFATLLINGKKPKKDLNILDQHLTLTNTSILKIIAITASEVLDNHQLQNNYEILSALEESESVSCIIITNKNDRVKYATNRKFQNLLISQVFPTTESQDTEEEKPIHGLLNVVSIPIYNTYGKIGSAYLLLDQ